MREKAYQITKGEVHLRRRGHHLSSQAAEPSLITGENL